MNGHEVVTATTNGLVIAAIIFALLAFLVVVILIIIAGAKSDAWLKNQEPEQEYFWRCKRCGMTVKEGYTEPVVCGMAAQGPVVSACPMELISE